MRNLWKDIVFGVIKGSLEGTVLFLNVFLIWLLLGWLLNDTFASIEIILIIDVCYPILTALLLTLLPKRNHMLKSILVRDASALVSFLITLVICFFSGYFWGPVLDQIHAMTFELGHGVLLVVTVVTQLISTAVIEVLILLVTSIVTLIAAQKNKKEKQSADQPERNEE